MKMPDFTIFPVDDPEQKIRLNRFFMGVGAHAMNAVFVFLCWAMGYLDRHVVAIYLILALVLNASVYLMLRSGLNKRFSDPSLTFLQISLAALPGLYSMYFAGDARGAFLLLGLAMFVFGMFRFKTREFAALALVILVGYGMLIALLLVFHADEIKLKMELLQWMAYAVTLMQLSFLAGFIRNLRSTLHDKAQQLAAQNVELESALQRIGDLAVRDELTGVYNRRYLMERISEETLRCVRSGSVFCICMIDIDFFKKVNDTYGHLVGDEILRAVASTASSALRQTDCFGRFGGEEFLMLLTDTPLEGAMTTAERVRYSIESLCFPEIDQRLRVTVSIGVAEHIRKTEPNATIKLADEALYRAKENGRNQCLAAPSS